MASRELATHDNTTALIDTVDLENALCKVDTDSGKGGVRSALIVWRFESGADVIRCLTFRGREPDTRERVLARLWPFKRRCKAHRAKAPVGGNEVLFGGVCVVM